MIPAPARRRAVQRAGSGPKENGPGEGPEPGPSVCESADGAAGYSIVCTRLLRARPGGASMALSAWPVVPVKMAW